MAIKEKGYSRWQGELSSGRRHWLPIFANGIGSVWRRKFSKLVFAFSAIPFLFFLAAVWAITKPELKFLTEILRGFRTDEQIFNLFYSDSLPFIMFVLAAFAGADLVAHDLKVRSLPLYFSRPLTKAEYLLGKFAIIAFYLLLFTLVPGLILYAAKLIFTGAISLQPRFLLALILYPLVTSLFLAAMTLAVSILSYNTTLIRVLIFVLYALSNTLGSQLQHIFGSDYFLLLSVNRNFKQLGHLLFGAGTKWDYPAWISLAILLALTLCFCAVLYFRIRKVEAQS